ncbi:MAG: hypothetical protein ACYTJ0_01740 [Planctomycetota bacterium]|jgi:hypothetical protein
MLILKIAAGVVVGFVALAALLFLLARLILWRMARNMMREMGAAGVPPARITLDDTEPFAWRDERWLDEETSSLERAGFVHAGDFAITEMPGVRVRGFAHPEHGTLAALTDHPRAGRWTDLVRVSDDGACLCVTGSPATGLAVPPWKTEVRETGATADRLCTLLQEHRGDLPAPASGDAHDFADAFEASYARDMDWMLERGGPTEQEISAVARLSGQDADPQAVTSLRSMWASHAAAHRDAQLRERFLQTTDMSVAQWTQIEGGLVFVHDRMDAEDLDGLVADVLDWEDEGACEAICERARAQRGDATGRAAFVRLNEQLPAGRRYRQIGTVDEPFPADVYVMADVDDEAAPGDLRRAG